MAGLRHHSRIGRVDAAIALLLANVAVGLCLLESTSVAPAWRLSSAAVALAAAVVLPLLSRSRPWVALVVAVALGSVAAGVVPVAALVVRRVLRRSDLVLVATVPLVAAAVMGGGFAVRAALGLAPGVRGTIVATAIWTVTVVALATISDRSRSASTAPGALARIPEVDREWLSQQIHDGVGHRLALLGLRARIRSTAPEPSSGEWRAVVDDIERAFDDLNRLLSELDIAPTVDPRAVLDTYIAQARAAGATIRVEGRRRLDRVDEAIAELAVRVCTEGLANALKYADPGVIRVRFTLDTSGFEVAVSSPCTECRPGRAGGGRGLDRLRECVELAGGELRVGAERGSYVLASRFGSQTAPIMMPTRPSLERTPVAG